MFREHTHKLVFLFFLFFLSIGVHAQQIEGTYSSPQVEGIDLDDPEDPNYVYTTRADLRPDDVAPAPVPLLKSNVVVRYESKASAYLRFDMTQIDLSFAAFTLVNERGGGIPVIPNSKGEILLNDLQTDTDYYLFYLGADGEDYSVAHLSTFERYEEADFIVMQPHIFHPLSAWFRGHHDGDLVSFVKKQNDWHELEKVWFIQQYFFYGRALSDRQEGIFPEVSPADFDGDENGEKDGKKSCLCRPFQLSVETDLAPGSPAHASGPRDGKWETNYDGDERNFSRAGKMWYAFGMKGPAKYNQVWIESPRCTRGDNYRNEIGGDPEELEGVGINFSDNTGGNQATLYYLFACVGLGDFKPSDCPCERAVSVRVSYKYSVTAQAEAQIIGGGICRGSRSSLASAEDVVAVFWTPDVDVPGMPTVLDEGRIGAGRLCI